jgi:hypothetical protein
MQRSSSPRPTDCGVAPLGGLLAGWLAQTGGTQLAFAVGGAGAVIATAVAAGALAAGRPTPKRAFALPSRAR